jgi:hypothetical protein
VGSAAIWRCYLLFIIYYLLFIIYYLLFIIYYLLFIIYYLLFIIYYLLLSTLDKIKAAHITPFNIGGNECCLTIYD